MLRDLIRDVLQEAGTVTVHNRRPPDMEAVAPGLAMPARRRRPQRPPVW